MKLFAWQWLAISSLLIATLAASAETRPQYGGTLHVTMRMTPITLDPAELSDSFASRSLIALIFDTLVTTDSRGRAVPALAESWQSSRANRRLQLRLRRGVKFHDGTPLAVEIVAASLRKANPSWNVTADGDFVIIEREGGDPNLLQELALPRNAIAKRDSDKTVIGTGPFHIVDWHPGNKLILAADEDYWRGRVFLDGMEIEMGKSFRDQINTLESGKADLVEIAPEQVHRVSPERFRLVRSDPVELLALEFARDIATSEEKNVRESLRLSLERRSMHSVLLQGAGQPAASLLPSWISGYGFVFSSEADLPRARQLRNQLRAVPALTMGYDTGDPLARLLAERIALNAKDAGLSVQLNSSATDLRLLRVPVACCDPWTALEELDAQLGLPISTGRSYSVEELYAAEQAILATDRAIPLFHLPASYASTTSCRGWLVSPDGSLDLANAWLKSAQP